MGFDVHRLVQGRPLFLGGVNIPFESGLSGHSDADVLIHALCDALLGAAGKRDIGHYFPPGNPRFKNISSMLLLQEVAEIIAKDFSISNVDCIIAAEKPYLSPYIEEMNENIRRALSIKEGSVSVKATTTEGLGVIGEGKAIAAYAVVCLAERST